MKNMIKKKKKKKKNNGTCVRAGGAERDHTTE